MLWYFQVDSEGTQQLRPRLPSQAVPQSSLIQQKQNTGHAGGLNFLVATLNTAGPGEVEFINMLNLLYLKYSSHHVIDNF